MDEIRNPTTSEIAAKNGIIESLSRAVSFVLEGEEDPALLRGELVNLSTIGILYYEGREGCVPTDVLSRGLKILLGEILVKNIEGFAWKMMVIDGVATYCATCKYLDQPVMIEQIEDRYDLPEIDGDQPDLLDIVRYAYEEIEREYLRKRYGMWVPSQDGDW